MPNLNTPALIFVEVLKIFEPGAKNIITKHD